MAARTLKSLVRSPHRQGATTNLYRISRQDADRIKQVEARGGHNEGLKVLLEILFKRPR